MTFRAPRKGPFPAAKQVDDRFEVAPTVGWTGCECITETCRHGDSRMREYLAWTVWDKDGDNGRGDHAHATVKDFRFDVEYERQRDAVADVKRYREQEDEALR